MYSEFWSNKAPHASGNAGEMLRELVRIGFEQAVARAEASARMARSLAGCRTPLDAIAVYQDWMVNESQRVVADMRRMAELTRTLLQQSGEAALLDTTVGPAAEAADAKAAAKPAAPVAAKAQAVDSPSPGTDTGTASATVTQTAGPSKAEMEAQMKAKVAPTSFETVEASKPVRKTTRRKQPTVAEP